MLAIVCPGQGSQAEGFLKPWLELPNATELLTTWSEATGVDLLKHGTESGEETIKDTAIAQPLIVAAGLLSAQFLELDQLPEASWMTAGHSVGEITASALAGVFTDTEALNFVRVRAQGMASAAGATPTGMAAVLGGEQDDVVAHLKNLDLVPANMNGGGQIVAAGSTEALAQLSENPPAKTRVIPLKVAGAFHTDFMASAVQELKNFATSLPPRDTPVEIISNRDGQTVTDGNQVIGQLIDQVTRPVRWDLCQQSLADRKITGLIELLPGGTLTGLARRSLKGIPTVAIKSPDDLDKAKAFITEHAG